MAPGRIPRGVTMRRPRTTRSGRSTSEPDQIQFDFLIAVVARPQIQWSAGHLVHERDRIALASQINRLQIMPARVTRVDTKMIERRGMKVAETMFVFLATLGAPNASERPRGEAGRANELSAAAVGPTSAHQDRKLRSASAERADALARHEIAVRGA